MIRMTSSRKNELTNTNAVLVRNQKPFDHRQPKTENHAIIFLEPNEGPYLTEWRL